MRAAARAVRSTAAVLVWLACAAGCTGERGELRLRLVDAGTGRATPARLEVLDANGMAWIAEDALRVAGDCGEPQLRTGAGIPGAVFDPVRGTLQFYADGVATLRLPPGTYRIAARKGPEYRVTRADAAVSSGSAVERELRLERWIDMAERGWVGADDHIHVARSGRDDDLLARWMEAEDLDVANLLQIGLPDGAKAALQASFGPASAFRRGDTLLASGQESPRTHNLGHAILLGVPEWVHFPDRYLVYRDFFRAARAAGGLSGYAHFGAGGARDGLAIDAPTGLVDFLEVLQFGILGVDVFYEMLDAGFRLTPTAGTDYPCGNIGHLPGTERFYTRMDGPLGYESWLAAVRTGRTFVTNGPMLEVDVAGRGPGEDVGLAAPGAVPVRATVRWDPGRDDVERLEVMLGGRVVAQASEETADGAIALEADVEVTRSTWIAVRASGRRRDARSDEAQALAHAAPVWVAVAGTPPVAEQPVGRGVAEALLARLAAVGSFFAGSPAVGEGERRALVDAIESARAFYADRLGRSSDAAGAKAGGSGEGRPPPRVGGDAPDS